MSTEAPIGWGFSRSIDLYGDQAYFTGTLGMVETYIGVYPRSLIDPNSVAPTKTYTSYDLQAFFPADQQVYLYIPGAVAGDFPTSDTAAPSSQWPTCTESPTLGVTLDCATVPTNRVGIPLRNFNPPQDYGNIPSLIRMAEGKQYTLRFHLTATSATNRQAQVLMRGYAGGQYWAQKLEVGGSWAASSASNRLAQQVVPGIGCLNPDKLVPGEAGGWYTMVMHSCLNQNIRPDVVGSTIQARMPRLSAEPNTGSAAYTQCDRSIRAGINVFDTLSTGPNAGLEVGNVRIDGLEFREYNLVPDGYGQ
jgi:hypothetical protein